MSRREGSLDHLGSGRGGLGRGRLQLETSLLRGELGLGLSELRTRREGTLANVREVAVGGRRVPGGHGILAKSGRLGAKARGVGSRLAAELGKVEIGPGTVSHIHGLEEASLGVVAVEDDAVKKDAEDPDDDLDDDTDHGPVLEAADERIVYLVAKDIGSSVREA